MAHSALRIAVADDEGFMRKYLQTILPRLGHQVVTVAETGRELVEQCKQVRPDLVITDVNMPEMDGLEAAAAIYDMQPMPIIVISGYHGPEVIERTIAAHVMAYLVKPIKQSDLEPVITLAIRRFQQMQSLRQETEDLRGTLEDRTVIEKALQVLMQWAKQGQEESLQRLENLASEKNLSLGEIARMIILAEEALAPKPEGAGETPIRQLDVPAAGNGTAQDDGK